MSAVAVSVPVRATAVGVPESVAVIVITLLALVAVLLAMSGVSFDQSLVLSVAALSTTGPLIDVAAETPIRLAELGGWAKGILCAAMVLGRLETLAIIALFTPDLWRR